MAFDFACPDWADRLGDGLTPIADLPLDEALAAEAVAIFNNLRLPDVPGKPALREAAGEWMRDIVRAVFGSMESSADGIMPRQVGEVFCLVPKKNSKTTNAAALGLTFLLLNKRHHADLLIIGPTQKISETAFEQAKGMIESDPEGYLQKRFHIQEHKKQIVDRVTKARLMIRTFGMDVLTGVKPIFCIIDEIHILGNVPYAADVIRQIRGGMLPFPEALLFMITTQSDHQPAGVFKSELAYARGVRDGRVTEGVRLLPVLYEFPEAVQTSEDKDWLNPEIWRMVTPNLGLSITLDRLIVSYQRAVEDGDEEVAAWATQHLNVEVGLALHSNRWLGADYWLDAVDDKITLDYIIEHSDVCCVGIDGGGLDDLLGVAVIGRHKKTSQWMHWAKAWAHPDVLKKRKSISERITAFAKFGQLTICEDPTQDLTEVADIIGRLKEAHLLPGEAAIGLDPFGVAALIDEISGRGVPDEMMIGVRQGAALSPAVWALPRKLKDGTFVHGGLDLMTWCVENAVAEQRGNAILITKQTAGKSKIDPLVATFNAVMLMSRNPVPAITESVYSQRGLLVI